MVMLAPEVVTVEGGVGTGEYEGWVCDCEQPGALGLAQRAAPDIALRDLDVQRVACTLRLVTAAPRKPAEANRVSLPHIAPHRAPSQYRAARIMHVPVAEPPKVTTAEVKGGGNLAEKWRGMSSWFR